MATKDAWRNGSIVASVALVLALASTGSVLALDGNCGRECWEYGPCAGECFEQWCDNSGDLCDYCVKSGTGGYCQCGENAWIFVYPYCHDVRNASECSSPWYQCLVGGDGSDVTRMSVVDSQGSRAVGAPSRPSEGSASHAASAMEGIR